MLHCPEPNESPDEFLIDERNAVFLKESLKTVNAENWYAHYHMGLGYYMGGKYKKAQKELKKSLLHEENPWAFHALSCTCLMRNKTGRAAEYIIKGMEMRRTDSSYLKEGFKILSLCGADQALCRFYETMDKEGQDYRACAAYGPMYKK